MADGSEVNAIGVSPISVDVTSCGVPLNGTVTRSSPNASLNNSPLRCGVEPVPGWAKLYFPGLAFTSAISSCAVLAGTLGLMVITFGEAASTATGAKSLTGS